MAKPRLSKTTSQKSGKANAPVGQKRLLKSPVVGFFAALLILILLSLYWLGTHHVSTDVRIELTARGASFNLKGSQKKIVQRVSLDSVDVEDFEDVRLSPGKIEFADLGKLKPKPGYYLPDNAWEKLAKTRKEQNIVPDRKEVEEDEEDPTFKLERYGKGICRKNTGADPQEALLLYEISVEQPSTVNLEVEGKERALLSLSVNVSNPKSENYLALSQRACLQLQRSRLEGVGKPSRQVTPDVNLFLMDFPKDKTAVIQSNSKSKSIRYKLTPFEDTSTGKVPPDATWELFDAKKEEDYILAGLLEFPHDKQIEWSVTHLTDPMDANGKDKNETLSKPILATDNHLDFSKGSDFRIRQMTWVRIKETNEEAIKFVLLGKADSIRSKRSPDLGISWLRYLWQSYFWAILISTFVAILSAIATLRSLFKD